MKHFAGMVAAVALVAVGLLSPNVVSAQEKPGAVPGIIAKGFDTYQKDGALAAVNAWMTGSAVESDDDMIDQVTGRMSRVQSAFGRMTGYEVLRVVPLTASTKRVYAAMKFEKGVAWMFFDCYQPGGGWIVTTLDFGIKANLMLPPNLLGGQ